MARSVSTIAILHQALNKAATMTSMFTFRGLDGLEVIVHRLTAVGATPTLTGALTNVHLDFVLCVLGQERVK